MTPDRPISVLMIFTLIAALAIGIGLLAHFMRKRSNRHPMEGQPERNIAEIERDGPTH